MAITVHTLLPGVVAVIVAGCSPTQEHSSENPPTSPSANEVSGQTSQSSDACHRAGPLCRPLLQTSAAKCAGPQQTRPALGFPDAIGPGPVYPGVYPIHGPERPSRTSKNTPFSVAAVHEDDSGERLPNGPWHGNKLLWWVSADYPGGTLIRAFPVEHKGRARLHRNGFADALHLPPPPPEREPIPERGAHDYPSVMWVSEPGCYAWQIDGDDFSYVIYFNAVLE